jgi:hypothetical protein
MLNALLLRSRPLSSDGPASRLQVCPPALRSSSHAWPQRLLRWLRKPAPLQATLLEPVPARVLRVRDEFSQQMADLRGHEADLLRDAIGCARSLRELWHLRPTVYHLVSLHHSQDEAERRLARLNRHFPTRAPRSGFAPLEP